MRLHDIISQYPPNLGQTNWPCRVCLSVCQSTRNNSSVVSQISRQFHTAELHRQQLRTEANSCQCTWPRGKYTKICQSAWNVRLPFSFATCHTCCWNGAESWFLWRLMWRTVFAAAPRYRGVVPSYVPRHSQGETFSSTSPCLASNEALRFSLLFFNLLNHCGKYIYHLL